MLLVRVSRLLAALVSSECNGVRNDRLKACNDRVSFVCVFICTCLLLLLWGAAASFSPCAPLSLRTRVAALIAPSSSVCTMSGRVLQTPMPHEFENKTVTILCNDCQV